MKKLLLPLLVLFVALGFAQLDPTGIKTGATFDIYEADNKVGEIYVPARDPHANYYLEHWVLFPNYVYPGPKNLATMKIVPKSTSPYADEAAFFQRVRFAPGSKYVRVTSHEFNELPAVQ